MIVNGVIVLKDKNKVFIGEGLKIIKKGNGLSNVNIKKYGSGSKNFKIKNII